MNNILITISTNGRKFHKGDFKMPNICGVPVIPIYDDGKVTHYGVKLAKLYNALDNDEIIFDDLRKKVDEMEANDNDKRRK